MVLNRVGLTIQIYFVLLAKPPLTNQINRISNKITDQSLSITLKCLLVQCHPGYSEYILLHSNLSCGQDSSNSPVVVEYQDELKFREPAETCHRAVLHKKLVVIMF